MRIAMIDPSLFTLPYDRGLIGGLEQNGHAVTLFGRKPSADDNGVGSVDLAATFYRLSGSRVVSLLPRAVRLAIKGLEHPLSMLELLQRLARLRPDVIHFQWLALPLIDRRLLKAFRRVAPLVSTVHDTNPFNGDPSSRLQASGFLAALGLFDRLIVHTEQGRSRLSAQGLAPERLSILPLGNTRIAPATKADDAMDGPLTFLLFGKIKPYKGADLLIEAFAKLPHHLREQARVRIIGKPYMELTPLLDRIRELRLAHLISVESGFIADDDLPALFAPGTVAVFPYREIDGSGVLPEVLAHARPVVATSLGMFRETIVDGVHGHLVPPEDTQALAASLAHLIEDRGFAAACSRNAAALSNQAPSWSAIAQQTMQVYLSAASQRQGTVRGISSDRPLVGA